MKERLGELVFETGPQLKDLAARNPTDPRYDPIRRGELVSDEVTLWVAKRWIFRQIQTNPKHLRIHLNGIPRRKDQFGIIPWVRQSGYTVNVVHFTTPPEICETRTRPGRFEDDDPSIKANRRRVYEEETLPMMDLFEEHGISEQGGTLLCVDNTNLSKHQTAQMIIDFLKLPFRPEDMFGPSVPASRQAMSTQQVSMSIAPAGA